MHKLTFGKMSNSIYFMAVLFFLFFYSGSSRSSTAICCASDIEGCICALAFRGNCCEKLPIVIVWKWMLSFLVLPSSFISIFLSVLLSIYLSIYLSIFLSFFLSIFLSFTFRLLFHSLLRVFNRCPPVAWTIHNRKQSRHCCFFFGFRFPIVG